MYKDVINKSKKFNKVQLNLKNKKRWGDASIPIELVFQTLTPRIL
jgi:hypothetical protein